MYHSQFTSFATSIAQLCASTLRICARRMRHTNNKSLAVPRTVQENGVPYDGNVTAGYLCAIGKIAEQNCPKQASFNLKRYFPLVTSDLM